MTTTTTPAAPREAVPAAQPVKYQPRRAPRVTTRFAADDAPLFHAWRP